MHSMLLQRLRVENLSMSGFARRIKSTKQHYVIYVIVPFHVFLCSLQINFCAKFIVKLWSIVKTRSIKLFPEKKNIHISFTSSKLLHMEITAPLYLIRSPHKFAQDEGQTFPVPAQDFWKVTFLLCSFLTLIRPTQFRFGE